MGHETAVRLTNYTALVEVASAALGGGSSKPTEPPRDLSGLASEDFIAQVGRIGTS